MPTVHLNKDVFEKLVGKKLPLDELKDRISMLGTDLEKIEGNVIEVEVFPNRPDMLSEQGFARAFASFIGARPGLREFTVKPSGHKVIIDRSVQKVRPFTACAIVRGLKFDNEKIIEVVQLQEKLHITYGRKRKKAAIGIYPFEKITAPITFRADRPEKIVFRPLEFPREIDARKVLSQHPAGREYGHLLEGCDTFPYFVDAKGSVLSVPPIINSHDVGKITEKTTEVFIECSGFDFDVLHTCLNIIVTALHDMGGEILSMQLEYPDKKVTTPDLAPRKMPFDISYINRRLGLELSEKEMKAVLGKMGFGYEKGVALVPAYRADILHPLDLAEDIAIGYGFENFEAQIPNVATVGEEARIEVLKERMAEALVGLGLIEVNTYNLTGRKEQRDLMACDIQVIELANSISLDYDVLRAWLIPSLMEVLKSNKHHEYPQHIFGFGHVFAKDGASETGVRESESLAVLLCGDGIDLTRIRQALDYLFRSMGIEYSIKEDDHPSFIPGRNGKIMAGGKAVGRIGEISPAVLSDWKLEFPIGAFEIDVTGILGRE